MKTHTIANSLYILADILKANPNVELNKNFSISPISKMPSTEIAVNLEALIKLAKFSKQDWVKLVKEYNFDIEIQTLSVSCLVNTKSGSVGTHTGAGVEQHSEGRDPNLNCPHETSMLCCGADTWWPHKILKCPKFNFDIEITFINEEYCFF